MYWCFLLMVCGTRRARRRFVWAVGFLTEVPTPFVVALRIGMFAQQGDRVMVGGEGCGPPAAGMASVSCGGGGAGSIGMFARLERAVGDLAQHAGVVVQRADIAPVDLVGVGLEVVVA